MMHVLLVDDESLIRNIIAQQLDLTGKYRVVAQASDGLEALEKIEEHQPQIVLTDIAMPNYDGLYLAQTIQEKYPHIKVVIMSGYSNFEYAQKALKYGVKEYLLKPFLPDDLIAVLTKISQEIELSSFASSDVSTARRNFLISLIRDNSLDTNKILLLLSLLNIDLYPNNYCLGIVNYYNSEENDFSARESVNNRIEMLLANIQTDLIKLVSFLDTSNRLTVIWSFNCSFDVFRTLAEGIVHDINSAIQKDFGLGVHFSFSGKVGSLIQVNNAYKEAEHLWMMRYGRATVLDFSEMDRLSLDLMRNALAGIEKLKGELLVKISVKSKDVMEVLDQLFQNISEVGLVDFHLGSTLIVSFFYDLSERIESEVNQRYFNQFSTSCFNKDRPYANISHAYSLAKKAIYAYHGLALHDQGLQAKAIVDSIISQINKNIGNSEFSVDDALAHLDYSSSYMRYIFSQQMQMSIKEFLTKIRMETAKKLLQEDQLLIKDIAAEVGYKNQRYFASTFKSYWSLSPSEYRETTLC